MAPWPSALQVRFWMQVPRFRFAQSFKSETFFVSDGVHVQFLEFEDIAADPEGSSVHGESSDEIIYHRSQAEAGMLLIFLNFSSF